MVRAALMTAMQQPIEVVEVTVGAPRSGEVRVRIAASGVCHSDLSLYESGALPLPLVLGHEAAGVIEELGDGVSNLHVGDHVIIAPMPQCGSCFYCTVGQATLCTSAGVAYTGCQFDGTSRLTLKDGTEVSQMSCVGAWSEQTVMPAMSAIKIVKDIPLPQAALIGCAVVTGVGAAQNVAHVASGETVTVVGCGGVGLNAVQGARLAGAERIVAVDVIDGKLDLARTFGATHTLSPIHNEMGAELMELTGGRGSDVCIEAAGRLDTMRLAVDLTRSGGRCVFTGIPQGSLELDAMSLVASGKTLIGNLLGMRDFRSEYPRLVSLYLSGELLLDPLISQTISLTDVNEAFDLMHQGAVARSVIVNS